MSDLEANKAVVRAYVAAFNAGDLDALAALFAPDAQIWGVLGWGGMDKALPVWRMLHEGLGMTLTIEALAAEGDTVAARYTERGTWRGEWRGKPPTGRSYELTAMEWFVIRDGRIASRWGARDAETQSRQIGYSPD